MILEVACRYEARREMDFIRQQQQRNGGMQTYIDDVGVSNRKKRLQVKNSTIFNQIFIEINLKSADTFLIIALVS